MNSKKSPPDPATLSLEITIGRCTVRVFGRRASKGWNIHFGADIPATAASKKAAIRTARDAAMEPGAPAEIRVTPRESVTPQTLGKHPRRP